MWTSAGLLETYTYDSLGRVIAKTQSKIDGTEAISQIYAYDKNGNLRFSTDGNGNITETTYDSLNRAKASSLGGKTTTVSYDSNGNVVAKTDWLGNATTNTYDSLNRLILVTDAYNHTVMKYTYDLNSRQITATNALDQTTSYQYDKNNRLIKTIDPSGDTRNQTYDNRGNLDSATDGLGNTTHYTYDCLGRLTQVTLPNGETTVYTYDHAGNVLTMTDAAGNVTTYEYNYANLTVRLIRAGGRTGPRGNYSYDATKITSYTYTADGKLSTVTDRNGAVTVYVYDIHGNLLSKTVTQGTTSQAITYTYDSNGNVLTMTDGTGTTTRTYDAWNRTTTKTVPDIGTSFYTYDITDGFDAGCSAESTVDPKGNTTVKVYDRVGRLIYVLADSMTTAYSYYADGSLQSVIYGNGSREDYTYTADKLLKTLVNKAIDGTIIDTYAYTYDAAHNLLTKTDSKGTTTYTYDVVNRLLTVVEPSGKSTAYSYDTAGNRSSQTETEGSDVTATTYTYDSQNRLTRTTENLNGTETKATDYLYDNNGNLLTVTSVTYTDGIAGALVLEQNNTYDLLNQLVQTITSDGTTVVNTYNGDGLRVGKSVNASLTRYLYEYDKVILELNALGDQTGRNVYGLNLISRTFGEDTFFYFYNGHADVTALLAADGTIAATYYYDAFGNILDQMGTVTSNILYAGYQYDPETGLYYLNARMYNPVTARFIQEDTYTGKRNDALSLNLYTYCHNEPLMYSDPTGHREVEGIEIGDHPRKRKSSTMDAYDYQLRTEATQTKLDNQKKDPMTSTKVIKNLQSFSNSCQSAMLGYGTALVKDLVVTPVLMNAALLASIASPGATPGNKILNAFGQYGKTMESIDSFEKNITNNIAKDKRHIAVEK